MGNAREQAASATSVLGNTADVLELGRIPPGLGRVASGAGMGADVISSLDNLTSIRAAFEGGDLDKGWEHVGGTVNSIGGLATSGTPAAPIVTAYTVGADVVGSMLGEQEPDAGFSADQVTGEFLRGMFGDKSWKTDVGQAREGNLQMAQYLNNSTNTGMQAVNIVQNLLRGGLNTAGDYLDKDETDDDHFTRYKANPMATVGHAGQTFANIASVAGVGGGMGAAFNALW